MVCPCQQPNNRLPLKGYRITFLYGDEAVHELSYDHRHIVQLRLGKLHEASIEIAELIEKEPTLISLSLLDELMDNLGNDANLTYMFIDKTTIYLITDPAEKDRNLMYIFGARFE